MNNCAPLAGCEAAALPYCSMLGTPCEGTHVDKQQRFASDMRELRAEFPQLAPWVLVLELSKRDFAKRCGNLGTRAVTR